VSLVRAQVGEPKFKKSLPSSRDFLRLKLPIFDPLYSWLMPYFWQKDHFPIKITQISLKTKVFGLESY
jgi:hypothetical protein